LMSLSDLSRLSNILTSMVKFALLTGNLVLPLWLLIPPAIRPPTTGKKNTAKNNTEL
jgi:hypothetical protein